MKTIFGKEVDDEKMLENYDRRIEELYSERKKHTRNGYGGRNFITSDEIGKHYDDQIESVELSRKLLLDRIRIKKPEEVWYKSQWFTNIVSALIGVIGALLVGWLFK
ncbi:MAG: hypothetical protein WCW47_00750 [Candidatus Paceibacterota bacterium]|jgi:hypothetical protein